jgi:hypothetical protein
MRAAGFVKFTFRAPGKVVSSTEIVGVFDRHSGPDFPLQLFNLTTPVGERPGLRLPDSTFHAVLSGESQGDRGSEIPLQALIGQGRPRKRERWYG